MKITLSNPRGEVPRLEPNALPENAAQVAIGPRLLTAGISSWQQFSSVKTLATPAPVRTIYLLKDKWLSWGVDVDVARGIVPGDDTYRVYLTAPSLYSQPRWTNYALATTGSEPYPVTTRPLGVPNPDTPPSLTVGVDTTATTFSVDITDNGNQLADSWTISPVVPFTD